MSKFDSQVTNSLERDVRQALIDYVGEEHIDGIDGAVKVILETQGMKCKCQSRKCAPHKFMCVPSIFWLSLSLIMMFLNWGLISNWNDERLHMVDKWQDHWDKTAKERWQQIEKRVDSHEKLIAQAEKYAWVNSRSDKDALAEVEARVRKLENK